MKSINLDKVILGGTLEALETAYRTGLPVLCVPNPPLSLLSDSCEQWRRLCFFLSLSGQLPLGGNLETMRVSEEDKEIKCFTKNSRIVKVNYETAYVFDDHGIEGLPMPSKEAKKEYLVLDWINVKRGQVHAYSYIEDEDSDFVKRIVFYQTQRNTGHSRVLKDACAVSFMTEKQLNNLDYSESYVFLKVRDMMKAAGIKGRKNGTQASTGLPAYLSIQLELSHREAFLREKNEYEDTETLKFRNSLDGSDKLWYNKHLEHFLGSPYEQGTYGGSKNPPRKTKVKKREVRSR